jgi:hypothetical protein
MDGRHKDYTNFEIELRPPGQEAWLRDPDYREDRAVIPSVPQRRDLIAQFLQGVRKHGSGKFRLANDPKERVRSFHLRKCVGDRRFSKTKF